MPSSTSNSRERLSGRSWSRVTFAAALISLLAVAGVEACWRHLGHRPTVIDTPALWAYHRHRLVAREEGGVALLGTSRMLTGFSLDVYQQRYPKSTIVQLAIPECAPQSILSDLADDPSFRGNIICELTEAAFFDGVSEWFSKVDYLEYFHRQRTWNTDWNVCLKSAIEERFCCRDPELGLGHLLSRLLERGSLPEPAPWVTRFDRRQLADYQIPNARRARTLTITKMRHWYEENVRQVPDPSHWLKMAMQVEPAVRKIQAKGGNVAFVRFPSTDKTWDLENSQFPKQQYWDPFANSTSAVAVHFQDDAELSNVICPDTSHIDYRNSDKFTDHLLDILLERGMTFYYWPSPGLSSPGYDGNTEIRSR